MFVWEGEEDTQQHTLHLVFSLGMQLTNAPLSPLPIAERGDALADDANQYPFLAPACASLRSAPKLTAIFTGRWMIYL